MENAPPGLVIRQLPAGSPVAALTVHRTVIHYRDCASLTLASAGGEVAQLNDNHNDNLAEQYRYRAE